MRRLNADFVPHKEAFVILCDTFFSSFFAIEFNEAISELQFNINDVSYLAEAIFEIFFTSVLWQTTNVYFIRLRTTNVKTRFRSRPKS